MGAKRGEENCSGRFQNVPSRNARFWVEEAKAGGEKPFPLTFSRRKSWLVVSRMTVVRWYHDDDDDDERKKSEKSRGRTSITLEKRKTRTDQEEKETRRVV